MVNRQGASAWDADKLTRIRPIFFGMGGTPYIESSSRAFSPSPRPPKDFSLHLDKMDDDKIVPNEKDLAVTELVSADELGDAENVIKAEHEFTEKQYSRLRWKIDLIIMPCLMLVYGLQYS
jgi:hypothetical protein